MKKLTYKLLDFLFISIILLFTVGVNLQDNPPPGWYQQTLPVNDQINDIFFLDSLNGWIVTLGSTSNNDTGYILHTTNGGENWSIQLSKAQYLSVIQFLDLNTGYAAGGTGGGFDRMYKTTNGGDNWIQLGVIGIELIDDMHFINIDTGWVCDEDLLFGGLYKTTNGGNSWVQQLGSGYMPLKLFFINKDTGWVGTDHANGRLYRTTNSGVNWSLQYTSNFPVQSVFFINTSNGWIKGGTGNGVLYTTDGGFAWTNAQGNVAAGDDVKFIDDSIGYSGGTFSKVAKSTDGGRIWGYQNIPIFTALLVSVLEGDTSLAWMGKNGIVHTTDGGGEIIYSGIHQISSEIPKEYILYQNYPNPFNPKTIIKFKVKILSDVSLKVYDISGKLIDGVFYKSVHPGEYEYEFNGTGLTSGVYFYRMAIQSDRLVVNENVVDTKKMLLIK